MKRHFILGIMAVAALASCNKSEVLNQESLQEKALSFSVYSGKAPVTKTTDITNDNIGQASVGVLAWRTGSEDVTEQILKDYAPKFMDNVKLTKDAEGKFVYSPMQYWPPTGQKVSFFAYAPWTKAGENLPKDDEKNLFHAENLTIMSDADPEKGGHHRIQLNVPYYTTFTEGQTQTDVNDGNAYQYGTDFLVSKKGNDDATSYFNQNLNKDYEGEYVNFSMKHALSKISFVANAGTQNDSYVNAKVMINNIKVNGKFAHSGVYNLFTEQWDIVAGDQGKNIHNVYNYVNPDAKTGINVDKDPFTKIADELVNKNGEASTDVDKYYYLTKPSHNLMVIPFTRNTGTGAIIPAVIESIDLEYQIVTYSDANNTTVEGTPDVITTNIPVNITLEAGKSYIFKMSIALKAINFDVDVIDWENSDPVVDLTSVNIYKTYGVTDAASYNNLLPEWYINLWEPGTVPNDLPWLVLECEPTNAVFDIVVTNKANPTETGTVKFNEEGKQLKGLITIKSEEIGITLQTGNTYTVKVNGKSFDIAL